MLHYLQNIHPINNLVLLQSLYDKESTTGDYRQHKSKLLLSTKENPGHHAVTELKVIAAPEKITWHDTVPDFLPDCYMEWEPEMELQAGDTAIILYGSVTWVNYDEDNNGRMQGRRIIDGNEVFYLVPYSSIYCIIRNGQIIPVNGYVLVEPLENKKLSTTIALPESGSEKKYSETEGIIRYIGKPVKRYRHPEYPVGWVGEDEMDIAVGDHIVFPRHKSIDIQHPFYMLPEFNGKTLYRMHRKDILLNQ